MTTDKKELAVAALRNGTVIDHIPAEALFKAVRILDLEHQENSVTIGFNLDSKKIGKKGIIKIADTFYPENVLNRIALIAPTAVINIIRDYAVEEKRPVVLPEVIYDIVKCYNPKCITNNEPMATRFHVVDRDNVIICCDYCTRCVKGSSAVIK
jgi:aspartate carbamoyltransferase regulatory subunit